jgi:2,4-didehydro-3-deoxy-L-rhamnonate hydrolase
MGTPPGIGMGQRPPVYLHPSHEVRLGIDGLGEPRSVFAHDANPEAVYANL